MNISYLLVAVAGGLGAAARYGLGVTFAPAGNPWITLAINVAGSLLLGVLVGLAVQRTVSPVTVTTLGVGFLGGFTTFSSFSADALRLLQDNRRGAALLYVAASVTAGIAAAGLGYLVGERG